MDRDVLNILKLHYVMQPLNFRDENREIITINPFNSQDTAHSASNFVNLNLTIILFSLFYVLYA